MENGDVAVAPNASVGPVQQLSTLVDELYKFRDHFFETHAIEEADKKNQLVEKKLEEVLKVFEDIKDEAERADRAQYLYLRGRALNVTPNFDPRAEEALSKALKLDSHLVDAWNELGECFWRKNNLVESKNCFQGALNHGRNKVSLRNLSIALRQESGRAKSQEERSKLVEEGLSLAKEAVALDPLDGTSWAVLGNAHLSIFFSVSQNPANLKQCLSAYQQAEKDPSAKNSPELHYNKATALKYDEEYQSALQGFSLARSLDPTWDIAEQKEQELSRFLASIADLVKHKGRLKPKKLQQLLQSLDDKLLGPFQGTYKNLNLKLVPLSQLVPGVNTEKVVLGRVVCSVQHADGVPFTFCLTDQQGTTVAITVYNLAEGKGVLIGDSVAIPEPYFTKIDVRQNGKEYKFGSIRVNSPVLMVVNGKKLGRDQQADTLLSFFKKPD